MEDHSRSEAYVPSIDRGHGVVFHKHLCDKIVCVQSKKGDPPHFSWMAEDPRGLDKFS